MCSLTRFKINENLMRAAAVEAVEAMEEVEAQAKAAITSEHTSEHSLCSLSELAEAAAVAASEHTHKRSPLLRTNSAAADGSKVGEQKWSLAFVIIRLVKRKVS